MSGRQDAERNSQGAGPTMDRAGDGGAEPVRRHRPESAAADRSLGTTLKAFPLIRNDMEIGCNRPVDRQSAFALASHRGLPQIIEASPDRYVDARRIRHRLRHHLRSLSGNQHVNTCGVYVLETGAGIAEKDARYYYVGLVTCGKIWLCPVCSAKIRARRAAEIQTILTVALNYYKEDGYVVKMVTLTARHHMGHSLSHLVKAINTNFRRNVLSGNVWISRAKRIGYVGMVKSVEILQGTNGWHPHLHCLLVLKPVAPSSPVDPDAPKRRGRKPRAQRSFEEELDEFKVWLATQWRDFFLSDRELYKGNAPSLDVGVHWRDVDNPEAGAIYVSKVQEWGAALELARSDLKVGTRKQGDLKGWTPFELAERHRLTSDVDEQSRLRQLWHEYQLAIKGTHAITISPALRARFLPKAEQEEKSDLQVAAEDIGGGQLYTISFDAWRVIQHPRNAGLDVKLLECLEEESGHIQLYRTLQGFGLDQNSENMIVTAWEMQYGVPEYRASI